MNRSNSSNMKAKKIAKNKTHNKSVKKVTKRKIATKPTKHTITDQTIKTTTSFTQPTQQTRSLSTTNTPITTTTQSKQSQYLPQFTPLQSFQPTIIAPFTRNQRHFFKATTRLLSQAPEQAKVAEKQAAPTPTATPTTTPTTTTTDTITNPTETTTPDGQPQPKQSKLKQMYAKYGKLAVYSYFGVYFSTLAALAVGVNFIPGFDAQVPIQMVKDGGHFDAQFAFFDRTLQKFPTVNDVIVNQYPKQFANFGAAWCLTKLTEPLRAIATVVVTKYIGDKREKAKQAAEATAAVETAKDEKAV